jgi:hypothetical protein
MPSTVIASMNYDPDTQILSVTYVSGSVYNYKNVPKEEYELMRTSGAKGIYLNKNIKGKYAFEKVS